MPNPIDEARRAQLLEDVLEYLAERGVAGLSLRPLAAELGTSARMLVYYFGTKENLLQQALTATRPDVAKLLTGAEDAADAARAVWREAVGGAQRRNAAILLQVMGLPQYKEFAAEAVHAWVEPLAAVFADDVDAHARATALVSGLRGILLDRFATGEAGRTDAAAELLITAIASAARPGARPVRSGR